MEIRRAEGVGEEEIREQGTSTGWELEALTAERAGSFNGVVAMAVRARGGEPAQQGRQEPSSGRSGWLGWEKKRNMERAETI